MPEPLTLLRMSEVCRRVGLGKSTVYRRIAEGEFPKGVDLGGGVVGWRSDEIEAWIDARPRLKR